MFCSECGKQVADNAKFCESCGAVQSNIEQTPIIKQAASNTASNSSSELKDAKIRTELKLHKILSKKEILCLDCGYKGVMGNSKIKIPFIAWIVYGVFAAIILAVIFDVFGDKNPIFLIGICALVIWQINNYVLEYTYKCPNCNSIHSVRGRK